MILDDITGLIKGLPELPLLHDPSKIFTDRSFIARRQSRLEVDGPDGGEDNEQLAYIGSATLTYCAAIQITRLYPKILPGRATIINSEVIGHDNLLEIAKGYQLNDRLRVNPSSPYIQTNDRALASAFKAYVGGLHQEQGPAVAQQWLSELLAPFQRSAYNKVSAAAGGDPDPPEYFPPGPSAQSVFGSPSTGRSQTPFQAPATPVAESPVVDILSRLNESLAKRNIPLNRLSWSDENVAPGRTPSNPIWLERVHYDGTLIGEGRGTTKKEAKRRAAVHALNWLRQRNIVN